MGKYDSVVNLFGKTQKLLKTTGKSSVLLTRPAKNINIEGLTYAKKAVGDVCSFRGDRTLCPSFLDDLMKLDDADNIKFVTNVKDRMLRAMGYSTPERVKVISASDFHYDMALSFTNGNLMLGNVGEFSKTDKIAILRHELDHLDRAAQLYKAVGGQKYAAALAKRFPNELVVVDHNFWRQMSKNADIDGFDVNRFLSSWENPKFLKASSPQDYASVRNVHFYVTEAFEASAYKKQKSMLRALGVNDITIADAYGEPLKRVISYLDNLRISDERKLQIYMELGDAAIFNKINNGNLLMKNYKNFKNGIVSDELQNLVDKIPKVLKPDDLMDVINSVEKYLRQGCYSIDDILAKGLV